MSQYKSNPELDRWIAQREREIARQEYEARKVQAVEAHAEAAAARAAAKEQAAAAPKSRSRSRRRLGASIGVRFGPFSLRKYF